MRKAVAFVLLSGLVALGVGCGSESGESQEAPPISTSEAAAVVNGEIIPLQQATKIAGNFAKDGVPPDPAAQGDTPAEKLYYTAVLRLVEQALVTAAAEEQGLVVTDQELDTSMDQLKLMAGGDDLFQQLLQERDITLEDIRRDMRSNLIMKQYFDLVVNLDTPVTDEEVAEYFEKNKDVFGPQREVRSRHVLIMTKPDMDDHQRADAKTKAQDVLIQARAGADLAELARLYSDDPSGPENGGDLGWFRRGDMVAAFDSVAFNLEPGELSGIVQTQFGYHVIKVEDSRVTEGRSLDEVREQIRNQISQERAQDQFRQAITNLRLEADVEITPPSAETLATISS